MKRINRYAALRIPDNLDYEHNINTMKMQKQKKAQKRRRFAYIEDMKNKKVSAVCYFSNGTLLLRCPSCYKIILPDLIRYKRYKRCNNCGFLCDTQSKEVLKCYHRHHPIFYQKIYDRRLNNRSTRHRLKKKHQEEKEKKYLKDIYPQITLWNENGKEEIITNITKEIRESDDLTENEKIALISMQIPLEKYRILQELDVKMISIILKEESERYRKRISESVKDKMKECNNRQKGD